MLGDVDREVAVGESEEERRVVVVVVVAVGCALRCAVVLCGVAGELFMRQPRR